MKKQILKLSFLLFLGLVVLQACKEDEREIGDPWSHVAGITSSGWILTDVEMIDEGNPSRPRRSLAAFFTTEDERMTINFDTDGTFNSVPGQGGQVFPLSGTWEFDLAEAPRRVIMVNGGETFVANLGAPVRPVDSQLRLELVKRSCLVDGENKPALGYRFVFDRQN